VEAEKIEKVLDVASEAGHILLENGAEISRVEDTMERISSHFGVDSGHFFVLSNGIFTTGSKGRYANVEFIPIRGIQLSKVEDVNALSYAIAANKYSLEETHERLEQIKASPAKPWWEQVAGSAFGAAGFSIVFGGGFLDCAAAFVSGLLLWVFILTVSSRFLSKIVGNICNATVVTMLCIAFSRMGFGESLANIIIGAVMPLIPGVPFVNGVRDLANSDYIAGITRLVDAMLGFLCIAIGVSIAFLADGWLFGGIIELGGMTVNPATFGILIQGLGAFVGTFAFAILFGVARRHYATSGLIGAIGWVAYLALTRWGAFGPTVSIVISTVLIGIMSRFAAMLERCPGIVFLLCGIFPLVPGAGIFWCTYYMVSMDTAMAGSAGLTACKSALAIVLGIILAMELPQKWFARRRFPWHKERR